MRALLVAAVLGLAIVPLPAAQAAEPLLEDASGDTAFVSGVPGAAPTPLGLGGYSDAVDLVALSVEEADETLTFALQVAKMDGSAGGLYLVHFTWRDVEHRVAAQRSSTSLGGFAAAWLEVMDRGEWVRISPLPLHVDAAAATLHVEVPKVFILDSKERPPNLGDALTGIHVRAESGLLRLRLTDGDTAASFRDAMPDDGEPATLTLKLGDTRSGHVRLTTEDRVRVSNGGSTTFVFQAILANEGDAEDEFTLSLAEMPESWTGSVQSPVRVPARSEKTIAVLASVPFEHKHGGFDSFRLVAQSRNDAAAQATLRLGVLHTPIPQPAGHHSDLYLHAASGDGGPLGTVFDPLFPFSRGFMNTESTHEGEAEGVPMNEGRSGARGWRIPLNPTLRMGLDFDLERSGALVGSILGRASGEASVWAEILLVSTNEPRDEGTLLAESDTVKVTLDTQKASPFALTLTAMDAADYVPYQPDQNLVLVVMMRTEGLAFTGFGPTQPMLLTPDFKLSLPLHEYHDRLTGLGEVQTGLELVAEGAVEKVGRPGTVMTYAFDLKNHGEDVTVDLDVAGTDATWGLVVPAGAFKLDKGATKRVTLAVQVPGDAATGHELEVLLFAYAKEDPAKTAIVRTLTRVSTGANATDDEAHLLLAARQEEANTPGFGLAAGVAALVAVALARRKR